MTDLPLSPDGANEPAPDPAASRGGTSDPWRAALKKPMDGLGGLMRVPGDALTDVSGRIVPAWRKRTAGEPRWGVSTAILVAIVLQITLPTGLTFRHRWILPTVGFVLLCGLLIANPRRIDRRDNGLRVTSIVLIGVLSLANAISAGRLVSGLLRGTATENAVKLMQWGGAIWFTNVVVFSLWYWELDRGGPAARAQGLREYPDLLFPQMASPELAPPDWEPQFADYLYLALTNATAFSPTDVIPLSRWIKAMMALQSMVSISTLALVIARAVNILR